MPGLFKGESLTKCWKVLALTRQIRITDVECKDMKRNHYYILAAAILTVLSLIGLTLWRPPRTIPPEEDIDCFQSLCRLQSVIVAAATAKGWESDKPLEEDELRQWWGPRRWPICGKGGFYVLPKTIGEERPVCSVHGDLLTRYSYPDEATLRSRGLDADDYIGVE